MSTMLKIKVKLYMTNGSSLIILVLGPYLKTLDGQLGIENYQPLSSTYLLSSTNIQYSAYLSHFLMYFIKNPF